MIIDGHSDILIDTGKHVAAGRPGRLAEHHLPKMREGGVTGAWCPVAVDNPSHEGDPHERMLRTLDAVRSEVARAADQVAIVTDADAFEAEMRAGRIALFLGLEGTAPLAGRPERVQEMYDLGLRWAGLTWNARNATGDGLGVPDPHGLTDAGREIVLEMERLGIVVDLTHGSAPLLDDVAATLRAPLAVTHSNAKALCDHVRNLSDEQLATVAAKDGIVGVNFFPALLAPAGRPATMDDIVAQAAYLRGALGPDSVTLAADFIDYDVDAMAAGLAASDVDYGDTVAYPEGVETTAGMRNVVEALARAGWSDEDVEKVAWRNQIAFLRRVEGAVG